MCNLDGVEDFLDDDAARFKAREIFEAYEPDTAWVIDIAMTKDMKCHLIELNSFSCSGLYACDLEPIVRCVSDAAQKEFDSYEA